PQNDAFKDVAHPLVFGNQLQLGSVDALDVFHALVSQVERLGHVVTAAAEAEHQKALECVAVYAGVIARDLLDFGLVDIDAAVGEEDELGVGRGDFGRHLHVLAMTAKINLPGLRVSFADHFLILVPDKIGLGAAKRGSGGVHAGENAVECGVGLRTRRGRGARRLLSHRRSHDREPNEQYSKADCQIAKVKFHWKKGADYFSTQTL